MSSTLLLWNPPHISFAPMLPSGNATGYPLAFPSVVQYAKPKPGKGDKEGAAKSKGEEKAAKAATPKAPAEPSVSQLASSADVEAKCLKVIHYTQHWLGLGPVPTGSAEVPAGFFACLRSLPSSL